MTLQPSLTMARVRSMTTVEYVVETTAPAAVALIPQPAIMTLQPSLTMARVRSMTTVEYVVETTAPAKVCIASL